MSTKTSEGLRERLFDTLDALIAKKIGKSEVEAVCYISEQIIKTANVELEFAREMNRAKQDERSYQLAMKREEKDSIKLLGNAISYVEDLDD